MACFEIKDLSFTYPDQKRKALNSVDLTIEPGQFIAVCGKSGCGKSTLLRHLKPILTPHGESSGEILFYGKPLKEISFRDQSSQIGFVLQNPDNQIVTEKVWHELSFGLESLGENNTTIRRRVAEMASYFGIQTWFLKSVNALSGGQKQLLNLASIMAMQPSVLILDEPTAQLDPIAASDFLATIRKINWELGTTIIITEHRLEEVVPHADRVLVMENGRIIMNDTPREVGRQLKETNHDMFVAMPSPMQIYAGVPNDLVCPLTVREGRQWLLTLLPDRQLSHRHIEDDKLREAKDPVVKLKDVWFRYEQDGPDVLRDVNISVPRAKLFCIVGGNGTGKSTMLKVLAGIMKPYRGKINIDGKDLRKYKAGDLLREQLAMLSQNPQSLFVKMTVELDLLEVLADRGLKKDDQKKRVLEVARRVDIEHLLQSHPYDLSGGEQQRAALAKVLLMAPKILLLDEPTKGIDSFFKIKLAAILKSLTATGVTIIMVSHDIEFCARYGDSCSLFFNGSVVSTETPNKFFSGNSFYTTAANRMSRHIFTNAVNNEDVRALCNQNLDSLSAPEN